MYSLVAVCHRRIHHNLYILPFVALVTFFFSTFLFFFSFYVPCYRLIQIIPYKNHLLLLLRFFFSLPDFFQDMQSCCSLSQMIHQNLYIKPFVALVTFFSLPFLIFFSRYTILLHFVTDWYKIFPIKTICHTCYFFVSPLFDFFFPFVALVTLFFFPSWFFSRYTVLLQFVTEGYTKISI